MVFENSGHFAVVALWLKVDHFVLLLTLLLYFIHLILVVRKVSKSISTRMDFFVQN